MTLNDFECQFRCLKPFCLTNFIKYRMYELRCYVLHSVRLYNIKRLVDAEARVKVTDGHSYTL